VLSLRGSNVDARSWDNAAVAARIAEFIETRILPKKPAVAR
jgi:hypothetical protein